MKVRCIRLLDAYGREVAFSSWLKLGRIYHVMSIFVDQDGRYFYGIISHHREGEWPELGSHQEECFEVVSDVVPSNWRAWKSEAASGFSPVSWQESGFYEKFYDHDPTTYSIFEQELNIILSEDP